MSDRKSHIVRILREVLLFIGIGLLATVLLYAVFVLLFPTDTERNLMRENRMYERNFAQMQQREELIRDAVASLQYTDADVYDRVFHAQAPAVDPMGMAEIDYPSDSSQLKPLIGYVRDKSEELLGRTASVDSLFESILMTLAVGRVLPPMTIPLKDISYAQTGASVGRRLNPFYKAYMEHTGLDFIAMSGTPVYASADGVVTCGGTFHKTLGKVVEIEHRGGYLTRYAHLETVLVRRGQKVRRGDRIGTVGMSGRAYAPHLHYEVWKNGVYVNPLDYVFASVRPEEYANMVYMTKSTMQSMD